MLRKNWLIGMFNDNDAPISDATEIFDILTGTANTLHRERVTRMATIGIMNESNVISLYRFIFHPSIINPANIEVAVKITEYLNLVIFEVTKPLINNELLFQLKRRLKRKHNAYAKNKLSIFQNHNTVGELYPYL